MKEHAVPFVGPYNLMVTTAVNHYNSNVSAGPRQFPGPSSFTEDGARLRR